MLQEKYERDQQNLSLIQEKYVDIENIINSVSFS